MPIRPHLNGLS